MIAKLKILLMCICLPVLMLACGGGGGGSNPVYTKAILKVSTANVPSGTRVGGAQLSVVLPIGVTPSVLSGNDATNSVTASGNAISGSLTASSYDAVTKTLTPGTISGSGFVSGEFLTINCSIAPGVTVNATDFPQKATIIELFDSSNTPITGAELPISVTLL